MTSEVKHAPLKAIKNPLDANETVIVGADNGVIAFMGSALDDKDEVAEFIVRACNSYPDMLEALKEAEARDQSLHDYDDLECFVDDPETHAEYIHEYRRRTRQRLAIAKAEDRS